MLNLRGGFVALAFTGFLGHAEGQAAPPLETETERPCLSYENFFARAACEWGIVPSKGEPRVDPVLNSTPPAPSNPEDNLKKAEPLDRSVGRSLDNRTLEEKRGGYGIIIDDRAEEGGRKIGEPG